MYPLEEIQVHRSSESDRNNSNDIIHSNGLQDGQHNFDSERPQPTVVIERQNYMPSLETSGYNTQPAVHDSNGGLPRNLQSAPNTNLDCLGIANLTTKGNLVQPPIDENDQTERKVVLEF